MPAEEGSYGLHAYFPRCPDSWPKNSSRRPSRGRNLWLRTSYTSAQTSAMREVTTAEFATFVDVEVTKRFPDGLTLLTGYGQFRNSSGTLIREKSHVLILFYPLQIHDANRKIQEIRELYKDAYEQESVLRVDSLSLVSFSVEEAAALVRSGSHRTSPRLHSTGAWLEIAGAVAVSRKRYSMAMDGTAACFVR